MNDRFRRDADTLLSGLQWRPEDARAVLDKTKGGRPVMKKKLRLSALVAAALVLMTAVGLAIGLNVSAKYSTTQTARQAVMDKYGLNIEMMKLFNETTTEADGVTTVRFYTYTSVFTDEEKMGEYTATVGGAGGTTASWSHDDADPQTWENGDLLSPVWGAPQLEQMLSRYQIYLEWFHDDSIHTLPYEEQVRRYEEMSAQVAPIVVPLAPEKPEVVDEAAELNEYEMGPINRAADVLKAAYGLTDDMLALFKPYIILDEAELTEIVFAPYPMGDEKAVDWRWSYTSKKALGTYTVRNSYGDAEVLDGKQDTLTASWSLDAVKDDATYDRHNWGTAKKYDARILPWVLELLEHNKPIIAKYPDDQNDMFSVEDAAAYDQAFRDAGFISPVYCHALPKDGDISQDEAKRLALEAMMQEYGITPQDAESYMMVAEYTIENGGTWGVMFYHFDGMGYVELRAQDGQIQRVVLDSGATGNG